MAFSFFDDDFQLSLVKIEQLINKYANIANPKFALLAKNLKQVIRAFNKNSVSKLNADNLVVRSYDGFNLKNFFEHDDFFLKNTELNSEENDLLILEGANALIYLYLREHCFRSNFDPTFEFGSFVKFIDENKENFDPKVKYIFDFYEELPYRILRQFYHNENVQTIIKLSSEQDIGRYIEFAKKASEATQKIMSWETNLDEQENRATQLSVKFSDQIKRYNFLGLSNGFSNLKDEKQKQLDANRFGFWTFTILIFIALIVELTLINTGKVSEKSIVLFIIPSVTLFLFLFYLMRLYLQNINSIKSQILQIDLRMALCQFIHNYADQAKTLKNEQNKDGLEKFENIIFSPIVASDDRIPSTFDGMEQLAKLFSEFKGKS